MDWKKQLAMVIREAGKDGMSHELRSLSRSVTPTAGFPEANREVEIMAQVEAEVEVQLEAHLETGGVWTRIDVRWNMVFVWQAPIMLMSYSVLFFLLGLSIFVLTPLYDGRDFDGDARVSAMTIVNICVGLSRNGANNYCFDNKAAIFYIVLVVVGGATFVWCSFWSYRFVDLDGE